MSEHFNPLTGQFVLSDNLLPISGNSEASFGASYYDVTTGEFVLGSALVPRYGEFLFDGAALDLNFASTKSLTDSVSGDNLITFTRASTGTYVDSSGVIQTAAIDAPRFDHDPATGTSLGLLVEESRTNLETYSEIFTDSSWEKSDTSALPNATVSPDGLLNGTKVVENTNNAAHGVYKNYSNTLTSGVKYTHTVFAKAGERSTLQLSSSQGSDYANFDLSNGVITYSTAGSNASIIALPNGWYRCSSAFTPSSAALVRPFILAYDTSNPSRIASYVGDGTSGIYIWGAQLEQASFPTSYIPTPATFTSRASTATYYDASGVIQTAGINVARDDAYFPDENGVFKPAGLLLEAAGTNLLTYSEQFDNAAWGKVGLSVNANSAVAPDGTTTADTLIPSTNNEAHTAYASVSVSNTGHSRFVYAKAAGYRYLQLDMSAAYGVDCYANFDLQDGVTGSKGGTVLSSGIEKLPNGWYKCYLTAGLPPSGAATAFVHVAVVNSLTAGRLPVFVGDGTSGIYIWGAQLEAGSYATSYIPTSGSTVTRAADVSTSATVTRSADVASITGSNFSSWYNQSFSTFFVTGKLSDGRLQALNQGEAFLSTGQGNTQVLYVNNNEIATYDGSTKTFRTVTDQSQTHKTAVAFTSTTQAISVDGGAVVSSGAYNNIYSSASSIFIGKGARQLGGHIARLTYYPYRLPDADLQTLTK